MAVLEALLAWALQPGVVGDVTPTYGVRHFRLPVTNRRSGLRPRRRASRQPGHHRWKARSHPRRRANSQRHSSAVSAYAGPQALWCATGHSAYRASRASALRTTANSSRASHDGTQPAYAPGDNKLRKYDAKENK